MDKQTLYNKINDAAEMDPDKHDGSYALIRETVRMYASCPTIAMDYNDLNLVYLMSVGTWKHGYAHKHKCIKLSNLPEAQKAELVEILETIKKNADSGNYSNGYGKTPSVGMFGTGFYTFAGKTDNESVQRFIKMCTEILPLEDDEQIYSVAEKALSVKVKGMQAGAASMVLHCLKPFTFPVLNSIMGNDNAFVVFGVNLKKPGELTHYIENCRKIKTYRDEHFAVKNYRIFDMAVWAEDDNPYKGKILEAIELYKNDFKRINEEERYKWEAVKWYKDHWKIDEPNFAMMLETAFSKAYNLLTAGNYYPYKMLCDYAETEPEKVRALFRALYDEDVSLEQRILDFRAGFEEYTNPLKLHHYQDLHAITVYLTFEYPQTYYIYKYSIYKGFKELIGYKEAYYDDKSEIVKIDNYYDMCDRILDALQETDVGELSLERLDPEVCYQDDNYTMLAMDIAYFGSRLKKDTYWPSPEEYDPQLTKEDWKRFILEVEKPHHPRPMQMLKSLMDIGGEATCKKLSEVYGGTVSGYVGCTFNLGRRAKNFFKLPPCMDGEQERFFSIPFLGREVKVENGQTNYSYRIRDELLEALKEIDLSDVSLYYEESGEEMTGNAFEKNMILYGPPGTGKTYNTVIYAVAIIEKKTYAEVSNEDYEAVLSRYNGYKEQGRIEFTTFHQSYGYEEFIEGIKPVMDDEEDSTEMRYEIAAGVFKRFCEKAQTYTDTDTEKQFEEAWERLIEAAMANGNEYTFTRHTGSSVTAALYNQDKFRVSWNSNQNAHNDLTKNAVYKQWISGATLDDFQKNNGTKWLFSARQAVLDELINKYGLGASKKNPEKYVFIIDEINRGNISKIFGELITLIEPSKRLGQTEAMTAKLPYSQQPFGVPDNVYIIGTMNTADRSIAAIDTALRRRFAFKEMLPEASLLQGVEVEGLRIDEMLERMNRKISVLYDREHTIGHAYFMKLLDEPTLERLAYIFENKIIPLLQEYFYEDYEKICLVLGDNNKTNDAERFIVSKPIDMELFGNTDYNFDEITTYEINRSAFSKVEAYKMI